MTEQSIEGQAAQAVQDFLQHLIYVLPVLIDKERPLAVTILHRRLRRERKHVEKARSECAEMEEAVTSLSDTMQGHKDKIAREYEKRLYDLAKEVAESNRKRDNALESKSRTLKLREEARHERDDAVRRLGEVAALLQPVLQPELDEYKQRAAEAEDRLEKLRCAFRRDTIAENETLEICALHNEMKEDQQ